MSAMYYLSRGGAPEGPFEEARLVHMIQTGEVTEGGACPAGQTEWLALNAFPVFAQALAARGARAPATVPGYGAQPPAPTVPGYGPGPTMPDYGSGPTAAGYGPGGLAGYGAPQPQGAQAVPNPPAKKGARGLLIALLAGSLLLVVGGAAAGAYFVFFRSGGARSIEASVPKDCELLVEVPSVRKFVLDLSKLQFLDTSLRDDKEVVENTADSLAKAFDLSHSDAISLLTSAETLGISARKLEAAPEGVLAIGVRDGAGVEALLKSARFTGAGAVGQGGRRYLLAKQGLQSSVGQDIVLKTLAEAELGATDKAVLVWFPAQKVLALGSAPLVTDLAAVLETGAPSIEQNLAFQAAKKDFEGGSRLTAFVDPGALANIADPKVKELVDGYFTPAGPLTSSFRVKSAGFVSSFTAHITGSKLPRDSAYEAPQALMLADQLPAETFAYVALSTRTKLTGAETEKLLLDQIGSVDPHSRAQTEQGVRQLEQLLGVSASTLFDDIGGQAVLGLAASTDTVLSQLGTGPAAASHFNLTWVQELKDDAEYRRLATQMKQKLLPGVREVALTNEGPGFSITPRGTPLPISLRVEFFDKHLFVTAGGNALCDRAEAAFSKHQGTLKDDAAHQASLAALPEAEHFRLWIDTGRLLDTLLKNPALKARLAEQGMALDKLTLTGSNRVVSALSIRTEVQNEVWTYRVDALNLQALAPLGAGAAVLGSALPPLPMF